MFSLGGLSKQESEKRPSETSSGEEDGRKGKRTRERDEIRKTNHRTVDQHFESRKVVVHDLHHRVHKIRAFWMLPHVLRERGSRGDSTDGVVPPNAEHLVSTSQQEGSYILRKVDSSEVEL